MSDRQKSVELAIKDDSGNVIIQLSRLVNVVDIDPDNALLIAEALTAAAFKCKNMVDPLGDTLKASLVEKHRDKLIPRVTLMMQNFAPHLSPGQKTVQIVDTIFAEIFS